MARLAALLGPLATLMVRELRQTAVLTGNHFLLAALLLFATNPRSVVFLLLVVGLVALFPLSADPLRKIPEERLSLFPFSASDRLRIRFVSLFFSPVLWLALAAPLWGGRRYFGLSLALILVALTANALSLLWAREVGHLRRFSPLRRLPTFPGHLGMLVKKNLREMFYVLDPYAGMALAIAAAIYRFASPQPVPEAMQGLTMLVALSLSTYAQRLFALDAKNGFERYALLPIRGWQILLAKDLAFLLVLLVLVLPLSPLTGLAAGLVLLTFGHRPSVMDPQGQRRWCFVVGAPGWSGLAQVLAMFAAGMAVFKISWLVLVPCVAVYLASLAFYGSRFEGRWTGTTISSSSMMGSLFRVLGGWKAKPL